VTADTTSRTPLATAGRPALARCVGDPEAFARDAWGREPLLSRAEELPEPFTDLLSADAVDELVSTRGLRTPFLRVARAGSTLANREFTAPGGVGAGIADQVSDDRLTALFADGATMVLQALHRTWPPVVHFSAELAAELGHPVQVNAYVTPPQSQGFSDHYDVHDVFVLQVEGEKRWLVRPPVHAAPLRDQPWTDRRADVARAAGQEPLVDVVLRPGDCLYLPRGFLHAATALGGVSTHLTVGVHTWTRHTLAEEVVQVVLERLAQDADVRASLPLGADVGSVHRHDEDLDLVVERLRLALDGLDPRALAERLARRSRETGRAAPVGPLSQSRTASALDDGTLVVLRAHLDARVRETPGGVVLESRAGRVDVDSSDRPTLAVLLRGVAVRVADLPGSLGADAALVRRLLAAAVVVPA
jgi:ribosomal protein L16 Arg81 hydroxylase